MTSLLQTYPNYSHRLSQGIHYADETTIRIGSIGSATGVDLSAARYDIRHSYWGVAPSLREHLRSLIRQEAGSKLRMATRDSPRSDLSTHPCWPPDLRISKKFKEHGKEFTREVGLNELLIEDVVRLGAFDLGPPSHIELQKACYLDQLATNIFADKPFPPGVQIDAKPYVTTFRELDVEHGGELSPLNRSHQANTIGVTVLFFDADGVPLFRPRGLRMAESEDETEVEGELAIMASGIHCTSSGAMQWQDVVKNDRNPSESLMHAMHREIWEETGFYREDYQLAPICFARELERAGKPQIFFAARFTRMLRLADLSLQTFLGTRSGVDEWEVLRVRRRSPIRAFVGQFFNKKSDQAQGWILSADFNLTRFEERAPQDFPEWNELTFECRAALLFGGGALRKSAVRWT